MKRHAGWKQVIALFVATSLVAACGGGGSDEGPAPSPAPDPQPNVDRTCHGEVDDDGKTMLYFDCGDTSLVPKTKTPSSGSFVKGVDTENARRACDFRFDADGQLVVRAGGSSYSTSIDAGHPAALITVGYFNEHPIQSIVTTDASGRDYFVGWLKVDGVESLSASVSGPGLSIFCFSSLTGSGMGGGEGSENVNPNPPSPMPPAPAPGPGGGGGGGIVTRQFIEWTNSRNGNVVIDANNEAFSFFSDSRCIFSHARQQETSNFCLSSGSSGRLAGLDFMVLAVRSTSGGCIAALSTPDGRQIDIYTDNGVQTATDLNTYWDVSGCTS